VTSWSNKSIQMQSRAVDGSSIRFAQSEQTTEPRRASAQAAPEGPGDIARTGCKGEH
jgi:hypothetical protein